MALDVHLKPEVQTQLARQAAKQGCSVEDYAASLLEEAARRDANGAALDKLRAQSAAVRIRELRRGVTLGGLTIRQLIDEGRR